MAVKRSVTKKKAPVIREIKRAPTQVITNLDEVEMPGDTDNEDIEGELPPMADAAALEQSFAEAPLTPEQQAEKDALEGSNAAATAKNEALPERKALESSLGKFKASAAYGELMALPVEERRKLIEEEQTKLKIKYNKK